MGYSLLVHFDLRGQSVRACTVFIKVTGKILLASHTSLISLLDQTELATGLPYLGKTVVAVP